MSTSLTSPSDLVRALFDSTTIDGRVSIWERQGKSSRHLAPSDASAIDTEASRFVAEGRDVYIGVALRRQGLTTLQRGKAEDCVALPGLFLDIDIDTGHGTHAAKNLPKSDVDASEIVSVLPEPTIIIDSGHGWHCWWLFDQLLPIGDNTRDTLSAQSEAFQRKAIDHAKSKGWHVDNTSNLDRVLRLPGTINTKDGLNRAVTCLIADGPRYASAEALLVAAGIHSVAHASVSSAARASGASAEMPQPRPERAAEQTIEEVKRRLEKIQSEEKRELLAKVFAGESFAPAGSRDQTLQRIASSIAYVAPDRDPSELAREILGDSLATFEPEDAGKYTQEDRIGWAAEKIARAQEDARRDRTVREGQDLGLKRALLAQRQDRLREAKASGKDTSDAESDVEDAQADLDQALASKDYPRNDTGNAQRFVDEHGENVRYVYAWNRWIVWDGAYWRPDDDGQVARLITATVDKMLRTAADLASDESGYRAKAVSWALASGNHQKKVAIEREARSLVAIQPSELDQDPWLFNVANGTLDLRTGTLRPHDRNDKLTKLVPITFDPTAQCPRWDSFIQKIFPTSQGLRDFVQRAVGYSLTGSTREQCMFLLIGDGSNGKSTFIETIRQITGRHGFAAAMSAFIAKSGDEGINNDIKALDGFRFVTAAETQKGRALAEEKIKQITGGDVVNARALYAEGTEFKAICKLWMSSNHKPRIRGTDEGIWRRLRVVPFVHHFTEADKDKDFPEKLKAELPGILRWAIDGLIAWHQVGLGTCAEVDRAVASYRAEMDPIGKFVEDDCILDPSHSETGMRLYAAYKQWCAETSCHPITESEFRERVEALGLEKFKKTINSRDRAAYRGIGLRSNGSLSQTLLCKAKSLDEESAISQKNAELQREAHAER